MFTTRLSSVITGCGCDENTCSRMSSLVLMRSATGMMKFSPGWSVVRNRPKRSTLYRCAWGTIRTVETTANTTSTAAMMISTKGSIAPALPCRQSGSWQEFPRVDDGRRALDLHDVDQRPSRNHVIVVERARRPFLPGELDEPVRGGDFLDHHGLLPDERITAIAHQRRLTHVPPRDRPDDQQPGRRGRRESQDL